jgi:hypothetical protein
MLEGIVGSAIATSFVPVTAMCNRSVDTRRMTEIIVAAKNRGRGASHRVRKREKNQTEPQF